MTGADVPPTDEPMTVAARLERWPTAPMRTELIHGVLLFTGDFDEREATTAQRTYPSRRVLVNADGNLQVPPCRPGTAALTP